MFSLFLFYNVCYKGLSLTILNVFYLIAIFSSIYTIISKNPIVSVLFLILLFGAISCYLLFIGLDFIGISYLLVYIGAVSILFLFILMLINIRISELLTETNNYLPLAMLSVIPFFFILGQNFIFNKMNFNFYIDNINDNITENISFVTSNNWENNLINNTQISSIGNILYTNYSIWLIITSIILLLAMVGAIVITVNNKKQ